MHLEHLQNMNKIKFYLLRIKKKKEQKIDSNLRVIFEKIFSLNIKVNDKTINR